MASGESIVSDPLFPQQWHAGRGVQVFTDEFERFVAEDADRAVISAANGTTLNAAAVTWNVAFDLSGTQSGIHHTFIRFENPEAFRVLISGDGNDYLVGNAADNIFMPGRGQNFVHGNAGLDAIRLLGDYADFTITPRLDGFEVMKLDEDEHAEHRHGDGIRGVELLVFNDRVVPLQGPGADADLFDEASYLAQYPDVAAAVAAGRLESGRQHYSEWGRYEGRNPNALFSETWYLEHNPDVAEAVAQGLIVNGFAHYREWGWQEGRAPSAWMDTGAYLQANPDVAAAGMDPLAHFLNWGYAEGRVITAIAAEMWV